MADETLEIAFQAVQLLQQGLDDVRPEMRDIRQEKFRMHLQSEIRDLRGES